MCGYVHVRDTFYIPNWCETYVRSTNQYSIYEQKYYSIDDSIFSQWTVISFDLRINVQSMNGNIIRSTNLSNERRKYVTGSSKDDVWKQTHRRLVHGRNGNEQLVRFAVGDNRQQKMDKTSTCSQRHRVSTNLYSNNE